MRELPPRTKHAWTSMLTTLLTANGILTSALVVVVLSFPPTALLAGSGLRELDGQKAFPTLPASSSMSAKEVSEKSKPPVAVISPARRSWRTRQEMPSASFGAGTLLQANAEGFVRYSPSGRGWTCRAIANGTRALIAMTSGVWGAANVVARHRTQHGTEFPRKARFLLKPPGSCRNSRVTSSAPASVSPRPDF